MLKLKYANSVFCFFIFLHISNVFAQDTTKVANDSLKFFPPIKMSGRVLLLDSSDFATISKMDIQRTSYTTLFDVIKSKNLAYPFSLGFYGQNNSFAFFGANPKNLSSRWSNTPSYEPSVGTFNISQFPPEQIEKAQIFIGSDAVILSDNSSGAFINFQESIYNTKSPYSKLVYSQASDDFIGADLIFAQNFAKNWNFSVGFRTISSPGRFTNSHINNTNLRATIRYNIDSNTTISLSENLSNYSANENGGVDYLNTPDLYDPIAAIVVLNSFSESNTRNNLILDFNKLFYNPTFSSALSSKLFFSYKNNKFNDGNYIFIKPVDSITSLHYYDYYFGNSTIFENKFGDLNINLGADAYFSKIQQSQIFNEQNSFNYSVFELIKYNFTKKLQISFGTRLSRQFSNSAFSYGGKLEFLNDTNSKLFLDISNSESVPSLFEKNVNNENHLLGIFGFSNKWKSFELGGQLFARQIKNPINFKYSMDSPDTLSGYFLTGFENSSTQNIYGLNLNFRLETFTHFVFEGFVQFNYSRINNQKAELYPLIYGGISGYYHINISRSEAQVGLEFECLSEFKGYSYFPGYGGYYTNPYKSNFQNNGINVFARLKLGNAYVRLEFRNALGSNYYYVPFYPELGRHFRFIVNWAFLN